MEENNGDDQLYDPQVSDDRKPKIGMKFISVEYAFSFYNQYAREAGFSARISNSKKNKMTNEVVWKQFVCFKEGHTDESRWKNQEKGDQLKKERSRGEVRTGCKSRMSIVKEQRGSNWVVSTLMESHNHPLSTPSKVHLLRSHRNVLAEKKALTQQFSQANVSTCQQIRLLEIEYGGPEHVGCTEKDVRNFEKKIRDEQKGIDAETLIAFFESEKEKNSYFFYDFETDSDNRFSRCFWADSISRRAYRVFGDVIVFDTTYNTNRYGMIFAPFVGVNHHHQTIVFGCGFLSDEKTERFIEAMPKGAPNVIITDQDRAMTKAIAHVFPQTVHRYCLWHILNKFLDKLDPINFRDHYRSIKNVIANCTTPDEFDKSWEEVIKSAKLEQNDWLTLMALRHQRHNELVSDHIDVNENPKIKSKWPMETQMVKVYTKKKWVEFQSEMIESDGYHVQQVSSIGVDSVVYNVINFHSCSSSKPRVLTHDKQRDCVSCSCMKFDFEGIPCRHVLSFFRINQVSQLPYKYILKRWTRDAKDGVIHVMGEENISDDPERFLMSRHARLSYKASILIDDASLTDEGTKFLEEQFNYISGKIKNMNNCRTFPNEIQMKRTRDETPRIIDPSEVRTKGCGKRLKSSKEKSISKTRIFHGCGLRGVAHDKRNCPNLHDGSTVDNQHNNDDNTDEEDFATIGGTINDIEKDKSTKHLPWMIFASVSDADIRKYQPFALTLQRSREFQTEFRLQN
ncbi:protein FAR1-RELATED SEQUENCE 5-like [Henckelia pumila]|uniref:protein FAR1-RELATED SEQUENCE 5-like n=1 Tax=Henckelia pumila TaxID=405737 RepID=UPI003C6E2662